MPRVGHDGDPGSVIDNERHMPRGRLPTLAFAAPALLFAYGVLRLVDRVDGIDGSGFLWSAGHVCFLGAVVTIGALDVALRSRASAPRIAGAAVAVGLAGVAAFAWVILGDLFPAFDHHVPTPDVVTALGPPALVLGLLVMLAVGGRQSSLSTRHLALVAVAFVLIGVALDILPLAAVVLFLALRPLGHERHPELRSGVGRR